MTFKVFLSYSTDPEENAIIWRLQTLAASYGVQFFVPSRNSASGSPRGQSSHVLPDQVQAAIDHADCVLAIVTSKASPTVERELSYAQRRGKLIIPIVEDVVRRGAFFHNFDRVFTFSRLNGDPGKLESEIFEFLKQQKLKKENSQAVGAIIAIGIGMLLLSGLAKK
jgi:nucleoside 2-deoxyribosyltransferase